MRFQRSIVRWVFSVLVIFAAGFVLFVVLAIHRDISNGEQLQSTLEKQLIGDGAYVSVFGTDRRVFVFAPYLEDEIVEKIALIAFDESWVHELDVRNTSLSREAAEKLVSRYPNKRVITKFNSERLDAFLYD